MNLHSLRDDIEQLNVDDSDKYLLMASIWADRELELGQRSRAFDMMVHYQGQIWRNLHTSRFIRLLEGFAPQIAPMPA